MTEIPGEYFVDDHLDLFQVLIDREVDFVLVGGVAVAYHGYIRTTEDVDLLYRPKKENVQNLFGALDAFFGGIQPELGSYESFLEKGKIFRFGRPPYRVEFMNQIDGVTFQEVWNHREKISIQDHELELSIIDLERLLKNKKESSRPKDHADYDELQSIHRQKDSGDRP